MRPTTGSERTTAGAGVADGVSAARTRRWRRTLAGYTADVTTYVAAHVMPGRHRAPVAGATVVVPPVVTPVAPPVALPAVAPRIAGRDRRWPTHVVNALARILVALDWALGGGGPRRR